MHVLSILQILVLLTLANGAPVVAKKILGNRFALPLDFGSMFFDGRPVFGSSKTIRGIVVSILLTTAGAPLIGLDLTTGAIMAGTAMAFPLILKLDTKLKGSTLRKWLDIATERNYTCVTR